jgi:hypothetical protein
MFDFSKSLKIYFNFRINLKIFSISEKASRYFQSQENQKPGLKIFLIPEKKSLNMFRTAGGQAAALPAPSASSSRVAPPAPAPFP